jgi:hypothetical protein
MFLDQLEQKRVGGKIALLGDPVQYPVVFCLVLIVVDMAHVEEGILPKSAGLVNLKIETDARHAYHSPNFRYNGDRFQICPHSVADAAASR